MVITLTMFALGMLLGFVGAGGSGFIIAILTTVFGVPIHLALGTALAAMVFSTLSGAYSHFREGNVSVKTGIYVGIFGAVGAFFGSKIAALIDVQTLQWLTAGMLFLSSVVLIIRLFVVKKMQENGKSFSAAGFSIQKAAAVGIMTGLLSGTFGIGSTPFIQIGLLMVLGLPLTQAVGTTMLVILPIALSGGTGYYLEGNLDFLLLLQVVAGTMLGSYVGAKFTRLAPQMILKSAMVLSPFTAGVVMLI
mgnify:FL=1